MVNGVFILIDYEITSGLRMPQVMSREATNHEGKRLLIMREKFSPTEYSLNIWR